MKLNTIYIFLIIAFVYNNTLYAQHKCSEHTSCGLEVIKRDMFSKVPPPQKFIENKGKTKSDMPSINVTYDESVGTNKQDAFDYAVGIWEAVLPFTVDIEIEVKFESLPGNTVGRANTSFTYAPGPGWAFPETRSPIALANTLHGADLFPDNSDIRISFDDETDWYFGTDMETPSGETDFVSVALHEIGHGLGISGSAKYKENSTDTDCGDTVGNGCLSDPVTTYATFIELGDGTNITSLASPSVALGNALTSNDLFWNSCEALVVNGHRPRIHAPENYSGSAFSHLDEATYPVGNVNSLMSPTIGQAEAIHDPGPVVLAMLADIGWPFPNCCAGSEPPEITNQELYFDCADGNIGFEFTFGNLNPAGTYDVFYTTDLISGIWRPAAQSGIQLSGTTAIWNDCAEPDRDGAIYRVEGTCDTDGDGLTDAFEILSTGTNPYEADSDANGIPDGAEDSDCDGFTNADEYTNPNMGFTSNCADNCDEDIVITGNPTQELYNANASVSTSGYVTVTDVNTFRAGGTVELNPGFLAETGSVFVGEIGSCISSDDGAKKPTINTGSLLVYPNPIKSDENLNIEFDIDVDKEDAILTIHNINGQVVHQEPINVQKGENTINVFLDNYTSGMYLITIQAGTYALNGKLIIQ